MNLPLNIDPVQILLHLFNFVLLFAILYFLLYKPVKAFMDKRQEGYRREREETEAALRQAEDARVTAQNRLEELDAELAAHRRAAEEENAEIAAQIRKTAEEEAAAVLSRARAQALREKEDLMTRAEDEVRELIGRAAGELVACDTAEAYDRFLRAAQEEAHE